MIKLKLKKKRWCRSLYCLDGCPPALNHRSSTALYTTLLSRTANSCRNHRCSTPTSAQGHLAPASLRFGWLFLVPFYEGPCTPGTVGWDLLSPEVSGCSACSWTHWPRQDGSTAFRRTEGRWCWSHCPPIFGSCTLPTGDCVLPQHWVPESSPWACPTLQPFFSSLSTWKCIYSMTHPLLWSLKLSLSRWSQKSGGGGQMSSMPRLSPYKALTLYPSTPTFSSHIPAQPTLSFLPPSVPALHLYPLMSVCIPCLEWLSPTWRNSFLNT